MSSPQPEFKKPTFLQIYTAILSTVSLFVLGIILNFMWELKEWKGTKDQTDKHQDEVIIMVSAGLSDHLTDHEQLKARMNILDQQKRTR